MNQTTNDAATGKLLQLLETTSNGWKNRLAAAGPLDAETQAALQRVVRRLARSRKEFDSKLFILLVFGPLKSGKSTLVNCLVRNEVSPTALGISTTKRPCIILGANGAPHSAEQFFEVGRNADTRCEAFENVIDYLRGLEERGPLVGVKGLDWNSVEAELTREERDGVREPLVTVVRVAEEPDKRFLDEGVAVIDSPGLDDPAVSKDALARHEKTAVEWAVKNADLCVLVNSSLAAPGGRLLEFVATTLKEDSAPPLLIIQNRFDARLWRKEEVIAAETGKQQEATRKKVIEALGNASQKVVLKEFQTNLGLASDRRFRHKDVDEERQRSLELEDGLEQVEAEILDLVKGNREPLKRANCVNRLKDYLKPEGGASIALHQCTRAAQEVKERHELELADLAELVARVQVLQHLPDRNGIVNAALKEQEQLWLKNRTKEADGLKLRWSEKFGDGEPHANLNILGDFKLEFRKKITGKEINEECRSLADGLEKALGLQVFCRDDSFGVNLARMLTDEFISAEQAIIPHMKKALAALGLTGVRSKPGVGTTDLPNPRSVFGSFKFPNVKETWLVFDERFNTKEAYSQLDKVANLVETQIETFRDRYAECVRETVSELARKRKQELLAHLASQQQELVLRRQPELEQADNALSLFPSLTDELRQLATAANAVKRADLLIASPAVASAAPPGSPGGSV